MYNDAERGLKLILFLSNYTDHVTVTELETLSL